VDATDDLDPVDAHQRRVELSLLAETLDRDLRVLVDEQKWLVERACRENCPDNIARKMKWSVPAQFCGASEFQKDM
jgi:hypothetical protein